MFLNVVLAVFLGFKAVGAIENIQCSRKVSFRVKPADFNLASFKDHQVVVNHVSEISSVDCLPSKITNSSASFSFAFNRCFPDRRKVGNKPVLVKNGTDHKGKNWILTNRTVISGIHYNINAFVVKNSSTVEIASWNGTGGGTLEIFAHNIYIYGTLTAIGKGYRGGNQSNNHGEIGQQGESIKRVNLLRSLAPNLGGGGGGANYDTEVRLPGGGGSYGTNGTRCKLRSAGILSEQQFLQCGSSGLIYGDKELSTLHLGSGGGSGGKTSRTINSPSGARGGNGGGGLRLFASNNLEISGLVLVNGENGVGDISDSCVVCPKACSNQGSGVSCSGVSTTACYDVSGTGGGGSGGSLYLRGTNVKIGDKKISANGGTGGYGAYAACGGDGGNGRIRIDYVTLKGNYPNGTFLQKYSDLPDRVSQNTYTYTVWALKSTISVQPISSLKFNYITVTCAWDTNVIVNAKQVPLVRAFAISGPAGEFNKEGKYIINFGLFRSSSFSEPFIGAFPEVEVPDVIAGQITSDTNDTNIILQATKCWATPRETNYKNVPSGVLRNVYPIIDNSCSAQNSYAFENGVQVFRNYDTKVEFQFRSFLWPNVSLVEQKIYVYCLITICDLNVQSDCKELSCPNSQQQQRQRREVEAGHVIDIGPIQVKENLEDLCLQNNGGCDEICSMINKEVVCFCYEGKTFDFDSQSCKDTYSYVEVTKLILICVFGSVLGLTSIIFLGWKLFKKEVRENKIL